MRILAIDISTNPGFAVLDVKTLRAGVKVSLVHVTSVRTSTDNPDSQRYSYIEALATMVAHEYGPFDILVREHFTKGRNKRSTQTVFGSWAAIDIALGKYGYKVTEEITPTAVKRLVTGDGKADKDKVEVYVRKWLKLPDEFTFKSDDESDSIGIGLAYLIENKIIGGETK